MKTQNRNMIGMISLILILTTIVLFFILTEKRVLIDWLGFAFIIAAELILMNGLLFMQRGRGNQKFIVLYPGMYSAIGFYTILSIAISILYMVVIRGGAKYLLSIQIVLFAAYLITILLLYNFSLHVGKVNEYVLDSVNKMQGLLNTVVVIQNINRNGTLVQKLNKLYDGIRFCDVSVTVATDDVIAVKLIELQQLIESNAEESAGAAGKLIDDIMVLIKKRAMEMSMIKAGGI
ncbi:hypothetical protein [Lachnoclostridium phytofermentans]|uniref:Uncharacterized protein n=1 Tax=Lachnoclostridium phytofermentans (strain ATCC 700394 / DSM 18823 / ISDg) TaxID=357809 RepID=A9KKC6_LACP7|nr:hypothetical protein [Lachnoclostridium phytofermentans]ABX44117.1 hypothetical protein Cphy_3770 [Lachnoclostridium phytofermentans ISDg]